ncbi:MAG: hypothetical protein J0H74_15120 [Chitinophagaceae bacterium]|nr:hypothetical protein [Chitinophagaceae bacterium]
MTSSSNTVNKIHTTLPGTVLFILLYVIATFLYPGGSPADPHSIGFSWQHNYWCNLLNADALNGAPNTARPVAITALAVLSLTLALFWYRFPGYMRFGKTSRLIMRIAGILSMCFALLIAGSWHDTAINISGGFGIIAMAGTFSGLYTYRLGWLLIWGFFNLLLILTNTLVYNTEVFIDQLPVIQKISFLSFLGWICVIETLGLMQRSRKRSHSRRRKTR